MRIRHKESKHMFNVSFREWQTEYLKNKKYHQYDIIDTSDVVELYKNDAVTDISGFSQLIDRKAGVSVSSKEPRKYFIKELGFKYYDEYLNPNKKPEPKPSPKEEKKFESNTSDSIIDKIEKQLEKLEGLKLNEEDTKDDITQKLIMYVSHMFPTNASHYGGQLTMIDFKPMYSIGAKSKDYQKAWDSGVEQMINLMGTRIEEYELKQSKKPKTKPMAKDEIENARITLRSSDGKTVGLGEAMNELKTAQEKIEELQKENTYWNTGKVSLALLVIGGAFTLGLYFGSNKFDQDKIDLVEENRTLVNEKKALSDRLENQLELTNEIKKLQDSIQVFNTTKPIKSVN